MRPRRRIFFQQAQDQLRQLVGDLRIQLTRIDDRIAHLRQQHLQPGLSVERHAPRRHLKQNAAQRVQIRAPIDRLTRRLLWRDVVRRSKHRAHPRDRIFSRRIRDEDLRNPEVHQLHHVGQTATLAEQDVFRLQIAMDDPLRMRFDERRRNLTRQVNDPALRQRLAQIQQRRQRPPVDVLHHDKRSTLFRLTNHVNGRDVRMADLGSGAGFSDKALHDVGIFEQIGPQHFDRDLTFHARLRRAIDGSRRAFSAHGLDRKLTHEQPTDPWLAVFRHRYDSKPVDRTETYVVGIALSAVGTLGHVLFVARSLNDSERSGV